jgi:hypothetical protein
MSLYRLDTSIRVDGSHSRAIADIVDQAHQLRSDAEERARHHGRALAGAEAVGTAA